MINWYKYIHYYVKLAVVLLQALQLHTVFYQTSEYRRVGTMFTLIDLRLHVVEFILRICSRITWIRNM